MSGESSVLSPARIWTEFGKLQNDLLAHRPFKRSLAVGQRPVLARLVWAFDGITARRQVIVTGQAFSSDRRSRLACHNARRR